MSIDPYNLGLTGLLITLVIILLIEAGMKAWRER